MLEYGILTRPREAPPYIIVYGGGALVLGLIVGLVLRFTALMVLWFTERSGSQTSIPHMYR